MKKSELEILTTFAEMLGKAKYRAFQDLEGADYDDFIRAEARYGAFSWLLDFLKSELGAEVVLEDGPTNEEVVKRTEDALKNKEKLDKVLGDITEAPEKGNVEILSPEDKDTLISESKMTKLKVMIMAVAGTMGNLRGNYGI